VLREKVSDDDLERAWLARFGAPLYGESLVRGEPAPRAEEVFRSALDLARRDASVARALPVALWRQRARLDFDELVRLARAHGVERTLGFFLELTARLAGGDQRLLALADSLRPRLPSQAVDFFPTRGRLERAAAEENTPPVARDWGYRMNLGMDSFASMFEKATR
jgi:hypothetical protein